MLLEFLLPGRRCLAGILLSNIRVCGIIDELAVNLSLLGSGIQFADVSFFFLHIVAAPTGQVCRYFSVAGGG